MENVVPGVLQRLNAADILRMAGLNAAALGQEYCRVGSVQHAQRQGAKLSGIINEVYTSNTLASSSHQEGLETKLKPCICEIELKSSTSWFSTCSCEAASPLLCAHAAALLYYWLSHPSAFTSPEDQAIPAQTYATTEEATDQPPATTQKEATPELPALAKAESLPTPTRPLQLSGLAAPGDMLEILTQLGLSEVRSIARTYEIVSNGLSKQQLAEALVQALRQPEVVRRAAMTLQKAQRQLLAAITLAGGFMNDDDVRGLFERFTLGEPDQLQQVLLVLQSKAFLFRMSLNNTSSPRSGFGSALLDVGWYVPLEVRSALRVTVPTTVFNTEQGRDEKDKQPLIQYSTPYKLLADLLLVARALDRYSLEQGEDRQDRMSNGRSHDAPSLPGASSSISGDGSVPVPPPADLPPVAVMSSLQSLVPLPSALLRFAFRLLRQADIVYKDEERSPYLRTLANAAQLLLGASRAEVARDLFELWLTRSSYAELFDLQEEGLRLRCRATALNAPVLRSGELDTENSEARQGLLALLAQVPLHQWVNFPAFARFVYRLTPLFLQRKQRLYASPHWWLEQEAGRPLRPLTLHDWFRAEAHYLSRFLAGPLHWWGACDIASDQEGHLLAFRLTPTAGWLFGETGLAKEPLSRDYHALSSSLEIVNAEEVLVVCNGQNWPVIELLETFAQAASVRDGRLCYRLTPSALAEALGRGHNPANLLHLLRSAASHTAQDESLATRMLERLERWINSYGRVRIYTGVALLESIDTVVMRELSTTTIVDEQVVQTVSPTLHILKKSGMEQMIDDLKRRGQPPLLHDEDYYGVE